MLPPSRLSIPYHIRRGIRPNEIGTQKRPFLAVGMDTETNEETGEPILLTVCDEQRTRPLHISKDTAFKTFSSLLASYFTRHRTVICGFHNLEFDLVALLPKHLFTKSVFTWSGPEGELTIYFGKTIWGVFKKHGGKNQDRKNGVRRILIIDTARFFPYALGKVCDDLRLSNRKLAYPGQSNQQSFIAYAKQDAKVEKDLVEYIIQRHEQWDLRMTISTPQFAARLLRHKFVKKTIPYPADEVAAMGFLSYHGGKNLCYVEPGWYENVSDIDIISCYASCMADLPSPYGKWIKTYRILSPWGMYYLSGEIAKRKYPEFFSHDFKPLYQGKINACISGPEAWKFRDSFRGSVYGWVFIPQSMENPIKDFALYLYRMKEQLSPQNTQYHFVKLMANSVYGKFIQTTEYRDGDGREFRAGGLFNPVIGSWITSLARCKVWELEETYHALDTATDGIKTQAGTVTESHTLGGTTIKGRFHYLILRNKCCLAFDRSTYILNVANSSTHGIFIRPRDLLDTLTKGGRTYEIKRMNRIRESLKRDLVPNVFRMEQRRINGCEPLTIPERVLEANYDGHSEGSKA